MNDDLTASVRQNQAEAERYFAGAFMLDDAYVRNECAWLDPHWIRDPEIAQVWTQVRSGTSAERVTIDLHVFEKFVGYQAHCPSSSQAKAYALTIAQDHWMASQSTSLAAAARAIGKVDYLEYEKQLRALANHPLGEIIRQHRNGSKHDQQLRWTAGELARAEFKEPRWAVPDLIPEGLTFLGGRPKIGKSWLALQIAHAVSTGGMVFGTHVEKGPVLYLALEDSPRRIQARMKTQGVPEDAPIIFCFSWRTFSDGGLVDLQNEIEAHPYRLVIIDTMSRFLGGRLDQLDVGDMTASVGNLQTLGMSKRIAILANEHHRKLNGADPDPIEDILGSTGKSAALDCAIGLYRERGKRTADLKAVGRDMNDRALSLEWDGQLCCWQSLGDAGAVQANSEKGRVLAALETLFENGQLPTASKISQATKIDNSNVRDDLNSLILDGKIKRGDKVGREQPYYPIERKND